MVQIHKFLSIFLVVAVMTYQLLNPLAARAQTAPTPPPAPTAPTAPTAPSAPTPPPAPTAPGATPTPSPTVEPSPSATTETSPSPSPTPSASTQTPTPEPTPSTSSQTGEQTGNQTSNGEGGDATIDTGDASNSVGVSNVGNTNLATTSPSASTSSDSGSAGASIINSGNGADSTNTGSATLINDNLLNQNNSASVTNNVDQTTNTGNNSASQNLGNATIETGDANTTGTIMSVLNTNVAGVMVSEFNVDDDHVGDYVLDFAANCIQGCGGTSLTAANTDNLAGSTNTTDLTQINNNNTFQNNDATVENNMILTSDTGNNNANDNIRGDSTITTGDANVAANVLTFANNNLAGNVVYGVVNIFGDLIGDIILTEEQLQALGVCSTSCNQSDLKAANTGNGAGSSNTANVSEYNNDQTFQNNDAVIENNLILAANTGSNTTSDNIGGDSTIQTGDSSIDASVINIANSNISGGNWWLVIVNEAGRWVGRILGSPDGSHLAGSAGTEFVVDENGEITAVNSGNGAGSSNTANVSEQNNNTLTQTNTANIQNNIQLAANTGGNSASRNGKGDSSIVTGDANIVANLVNFVNNNIKADGRLIVTVVNVFGSWLGDFVTPGQQQQSNALAEVSSSPSPAIGGVDETEEEQIMEEGQQDQEQDNIAGATTTQKKTKKTTTQSPSSSPTPEPTSSTSTSQTFIAAVAGISTNSLSNFNSFKDAVEKNANNYPFDTVLTGGKKAINKTVKINLAWFTLLIPIGLGALYLKKRKLFSKILPKKP